MSSTAFKLIGNKIGFENSGGRVNDYEDTGNPYGHAMLQKLPYAEFEYVDVSLEDILNTNDDSGHGNLVVCDMDYTNEGKERTRNNSYCCYWCDFMLQYASIYNVFCGIYDYFLSLSTPLK